MQRNEGGEGDRPRPPKSPLRILGVAGSVALAGGLVVSLVAVLLAPRQEENRRQEREARLFAVLEAQPAIRERLQTEGEAALRADLVHLDSGCFDPEAASETLSDPFVGAGRTPADGDPAGIGTRPSHAVVYRLVSEAGLELLVLPVAGRGYQSRLEGWLVLEGDLDTVASLVFHRQDETPGMGGRIAEPDWPDHWRGKRLRDETGALRIGVRSRGSPPEDARWQIDAMTGATFTAVGITRLLRYWLGPDGFGPLLRRLEEAAPCVVD